MTTSSVLLICVIALFSVPVCWWLIRRARAAESTCDRLIREAHERAALAAAVDGLELAWNWPACDPDLAAGFDRLRNAIHNHREEDQ